jgi:hypothetical protein
MHMRKENLGRNSGWSSSPERAGTIALRLGHAHFTWGEKHTSDPCRVTRVTANVCVRCAHCARSQEETDFRKQRTGEFRGLPKNFAIIRVL